MIKNVAGKLLILLVLFVFPFATSAQDSIKTVDVQGSFSLKRAKIDIPLKACGQYIGTSGNHIIVAGGQDAEKKLRKDIYIHDADLDKGEWIPAELPTPLAFGATVSTSDGMFLIGGITPDGISRKVIKLVCDEKGKLKLTELFAELPRPLALCGAGYVDGKVYVVGGIEKKDAQEALSTVYCLDSKSEKPEWKTVASLPGVGRIRPAIAGFYSELHVFGGQQLAANQYGKVFANTLQDAYGYREKPIDGTKQFGWRKLTDIPMPLGGAVAFQTGQTHVALIGGVTGKSDFSSICPPKDAKIADDILVFHNVTDTWIDVGSMEVKLADMAAFKIGDKYILAGGFKEDGSGTKDIWTCEIKQSVKQLRMGDYAVMFFYFCIMAGIGVYFARKQTNSDEFALGGRNVKWWAAGVSMFATGASSISFMAIPAQAFRTNLIWFAPTLFIIPLAILQAYVIYPVLRRLNLTSTYEYLERRYHPSLRFIASGQSIMFQLLGRMSVVMLLPSLAISAVTGLDVLTSVILMGVLTTIYTAIGGFEAVIWTDFSQGVLMLFGVLVMIVMAITALPGGFSEFIATGNEYHKFEFFIWDMDYTMPIIWIFGLGMLMQNLAFAADQPIVQRVYATPLKDMRKLAAMFAFCSIAISLLVNFAGVSIFAYFRANPTMMDPAMGNDQVVPLYIVQRLPVGIAGLIIAALFAASMSTLSSSMNSVATISCEDFYRRLFHHADDKQRLRFMKWASVFVGLFGTGTAAYMASMDIRSMFKTWNILCALLGGGFIGIYILGMFTRRANSIGVVIGAFASIATTIIVKEYSPLHWTFYGPVAVISCLVVGYFASLVTPSAKKDLKGLTVFDMKPGLEEEEFLLKATPAAEEKPAEA